MVSICLPRRHRVGSRNVALFQQAGDGLFGFGARRVITLQKAADGLLVHNTNDLERHVLFSLGFDGDSKHPSMCTALSNAHTAKL